MKTKLVALLSLVLLGTIPPALAACPLRQASPLTLPSTLARVPSAESTALRPTVTRTPTPRACPLQVTAVPTLQIRPTSPSPLARGDLNVLLLGGDYPTPSWRTDTIIVVAVRPQAGFVALFSIPRDLWVIIPGYGYERINAADYIGERRFGPGGGPRLLAATLQENLGIPVHAYVRVDMQGLVRIIDALGGITVDVDRDYSYLGIAPGKQHMDGQTALRYARDRSYTSDLDRTRRQQQILLAMRDAALRPTVLPRLPRLIANLSDAVDTDLRPAQVLSLLRLATRLRPGAYRTRIFDETLVHDWITPGGAMVLVPNWKCIQQAWAELTAS